VDVLIISVLAGGGLLMAQLPLAVIGAVLAAATVFAFLLDTVKVAVFTRLEMA
jgi:H+-transporting ATPase